MKRLIIINYFRNMETRRVTLWEEGLLGLGNGLSQRAPKEEPGWQVGKGVE